MTHTDARMADIYRLEAERPDADWHLLRALVAVGGIPDETWDAAVAYVEPQTEQAVAS